MPTGVDLQEFVSGFLLEAEEHLHAVNRNLVAATEALARGRPEPRAVRELFRSLHTIKGLASMVGAEPIAELSHEMEGILRAADRTGGQVSERALDLLLQGTRALEERIHAISQRGIAAIPAAPRSLIDALALEQSAHARPGGGGAIELELPDELARNLAAADREQLAQAVESGRRAVVVEFQPSPERAARGLNIAAVRSRLAAIGELVKVVPRASTSAPTGIAFGLVLVTDADDAVLAEAVDSTPAAILPIRATRARAARAPEVIATDAEREPTSGPGAEPGAEPGIDPVPMDHSIRVDVRRLDDALERLSELVVTRFKLARIAGELGARGVDVRELTQTLAEHARQLKRLRAAITEARMIPLADLLQRLPLVVRGLTRDTHKSVDVSIHTGTAEVDKAVADRIFPAILHLVRNAVDHAIEPREERRRTGKPETGSLRIDCDDSSGTSLLLTVRDDGRGIDREAVARKLGEPVARSDDELLQQITRPGLSTREDVTRSSGRGMGMDIVRRVVEMLGGAMSLQTAAGQGTTFRLRVPVSVTIVDVFSFAAGDQVFVAPVAMVDEILEIEPSRLVEAPAPQRDGPVARLVQRRGTSIPLLTLTGVLGSAVIGSVPPKALVVQQDRGAIAFGVDRMLGQQEVVVRPLDDALVRVPGVTGATDLGDGRPTLVLDLLTLGATVLQAKAGGA